MLLYLAGLSRRITITNAVPRRQASFCLRGNRSAFSWADLTPDAFHRARNRAYKQKSIPARARRDLVFPERPARTETRSFSLLESRVAHDRTLPRRAYDRRHGRPRSAERVLHRGEQRRCVEDHGCRARVDARLRRATDGIDRRSRRGAFEPERDLRRERRGGSEARSLEWRRHLQID